MNVVVLMGRLGQKPEVRYTQNGTAVANYSIAVPRIDKENTVDWFDCVAWGKAAEFAEKYMEQGRRFAIVGRLQNEDWTDKDGNKRRSTKIIVVRQRFADGRPAGTSSEWEEAESVPWN